VNAPYKQKVYLILLRVAFNGLIKSQGARVKLMVCKTYSKQNAQKMLGNKLLQTMQNQQRFKKILFLFFSTFTRFYAALLQNFRSDLRATYTLNCTEKTYAKRLLSELLTQQQNLQPKKTMKKRNFFIYLFIAK
jgi:hypothetical protein